MSRDCCVALPRGAMSLSVVVIVIFPDHTHLLFGPFLLLLLTWPIFVFVCYIAAKCLN